MTELESENLVLRQFRESDLDDLASMCADPEVMEFLGGKTLDRMESWRMLSRIVGHWVLRGYGMWAVVERSSGDFVGRVGFINPEGWPGFEIGWSLSRKHWGKGYATEAARRALEFGFGELDRDRVISLIHPDNVRSVAVARRIGEQYEQTIDFLDQEIHIYSLDRETWLQDRG